MTRDARELLTIAHDHLRQYVAYAEAMRAIGRGMTPCSPYSPEWLEMALTVTLQHEPNMRSRWPDLHTDPPMVPVGLRPKAGIDVGCGCADCLRCYEEIPEHPDWRDKP